MNHRERVLDAIARFGQREARKRERTRLKPAQKSPDHEPLPAVDEQQQPEEGKETDE